jgi:hypothetical protein
MADSHYLTALLRDTLERIQAPDGYKEMHDALLKIQPTGPRPKVYESPENTRGQPKAAE